MAAKGSKFQWSNSTQVPDFKGGKVSNKFKFLPATAGIWSAEAWLQLWLRRNLFHRLDRQAAFA